MAKLKLLVATQNHGKLREINQLLVDLDCELFSLAAFPQLTAPCENGQTFAENALIKARFYHHHTGLLTLSDDSGLAVDALNGAPGIYSARYGGPLATDQDRCQKLLRALDKFPPGARAAQFICVLALAGDFRGQHLDCTFTGQVAGQITTTMRGSHGFGYDPIFLLPDCGKTFAELSAAEKLACSHRSQALQQLHIFLSANADN
jgi:XTP/dITP diphosphohydrolase